MYNFAPEQYECVLCLPVRGIESEKTMMKQADIFYKDELVMAAVNSKFIETNPGHAIIFPVDHYENIFDLPDNVAVRVAQLAKRISIAMKALRKCDGITTQQNNGPASGQHAFHYHFHIFPRWEGDKLYTGSPVYVADPKSRQEYAQAFKDYFLAHPLSF